MIDHEAGQFGQPYLARQADVTKRDDAELFTSAHSSTRHVATSSVIKRVPSVMRCVIRISATKLQFT